MSVGLPVPVRSIKSSCLRQGSAGQAGNDRKEFMDAIGRGVGALLPAEYRGVYA
jgi:hypothetical protein